MDLPEFVLARVAEVEAVARDAHYDGQRWLSEEEEVFRWPEDEPVHTAARKRDARHIVEWSPARVLAWCATTRAIVELHSGSHECSLGGDNCACGWYSLASPVCDTVRLLAQIWPDHPGFDPSWR